MQNTVNVQWVVLATGTVHKLKVECQFGTDTQRLERSHDHAG